jgi:uncharacterized protein HemX
LGEVDDSTIAAISASAAVIAAIGGIIGAGMTAWVQRRREAGSVTTSDAQTLFTASNQLIQMLLQSTQMLTDRLETLADRMDRMIKQQDELLRLQRDQTQTLRKIENGGGLGKE